MSNIESSYTDIATGLIGNVQGCSWSKLILKTKILSKNCSAMEYLRFSDEAQPEHMDFGFQETFAINDACIFLRNNLLQTTGERIWGLTFTLYPTGKFDLQYEYNKPDGYIETDDMISGEEINQKLSDLKS